MSTKEPQYSKYSKELLYLAKRPRSNAFFGVWPTYFYRTLVLRKHGEKELACERLRRRQTLYYSLHEHGKSVVITHHDPRGSLAHTLAVVERGRDENCERIGFRTL
jgi:hypothetical protein